MNKYPVQYPSRVIACLLGGGALVVGSIACNSGDSNAGTTAEQTRFQAIRKLGESYSKQAIVQAKKKAAAERKEKSQPKLFTKS